MRNRQVSFTRDLAEHGTKGLVRSLAAKNYKFTDKINLRFA